MSSASMSSPRASSMFERFARPAIPVVLFLAGALGGFVVQAVRADTRAEATEQNIQVRLTQIEEQQRFYLPADKLVTKEQFAEVVKRLDEKTDRIERGVNTLLDRQMKGR